MVFLSILKMVNAVRSFFYVKISILPVNRISNGYSFNSQRKSRKLKIGQSNEATALCMMDVRLRFLEIN